MDIHGTAVYHCADCGAEIVFYCHDTGASHGGWECTVNESCGNCRFWRYNRSGTTEPLGGSECLRFQPVHRTKDGHTSRVSAQWPVTNPSDWCGEHQPTEGAAS